MSMIKWRYEAITLSVALIAAFCAVVPARAASQLSLGPQTLQTLVADKLFNRSGRWYLIDDGGVCYTYLDSPNVHLETDRLVLSAHLLSRLGQRVGNNCVGADFASNVTLSGKLHGAGHELILDDIRLEHVDDEGTRSALALALQLAPQALSKSARIDVFEFIRKQVLASGNSLVHLDQLRIVDIVTQPDAVVIQFDLGLSVH